MLGSNSVVVVVVVVVVDGLVSPTTDCQCDSETWNYTCIRFHLTTVNRHI